MPSRSKRKGISLIEVLIVLAVLAVLAGLMIPAVSKVRMAAARTQCSNNLRQLGIAMHNTNDAMGTLPPIVGPYNKNQKGYGTMFYHLLPYLEEDQLYKQGLDEDQGYYVWNKKVFRHPLKLLICPEERTAPEDGLFQDWLATCTYAANWQVFGEGGARIPASFPDGTSQTMTFTERFQMCNGTPNAWGYPGLYYWTPMFAYYSEGKFQTLPSQSDCDPALAQSPHPTGINVGMGDASSRMVDKFVSPQTWWAACTPAAGDIVGEDW